MKHRPTSPPSYASRNYKLREERKAAVLALANALRAQGLEDCKKETTFFKELGIGESHPTCYMAVTRSAKHKVVEQWWAPSELIQFNVAMRGMGLGSKVRARCVKLYLEGKDLPANAQRAIAIYTERILCS